MPVQNEQMTTLERKIEHFSKILASRPGDELTILALAEASFRRGLKLEALTAYQEVVSGRPVPEAHLAVAEIYSAQGMPHEAYGELRRLFELDPSNVEARLLVNVLREDALPPDDVSQIMDSPTSEEAFDEARLRLKIQRTIYNRELQERTRNVTLEPGTVIHEYHMEEAKKKLIRVDELLRELERFREYNETLSQEPPRPETVAPQADPEAFAAPHDEVVTEVDSGEPAPILDELPLELSVEAPESSVEPLRGAEIADETVGPPGFEPVSAVEFVSHEAPADSLSAGDDWSTGGEVVSSSNQHIVDETSTELSESASMRQESDDSDDLLEPSFEPHTESQEVYSPSSEPASSEASSFDAAEQTSSNGTGESDSLDSPSGEREPVSHLGLDIAPLPIAAVEPPHQSGYSTDFDLSMDSPIAPDLPDLGVDDFASPEIEAGSADFAIGLEDTAEMIDLEPIDMSGADLVAARTMPGPDTSELESGLGATRPEVPALGSSAAVAPPTFDDVPVRSGPSVPPVAVVMMPIDDSTMILTPPEPEVEPEPEPEVAPVEASIEVPAEPSYSSMESESPQGLSPARKNFYEHHHESLSALTTTLARTRGVTSIYLVAKEGVTIDSVAKDDISEKRIGDIVRESFDFLEAFAADPAYWVLECGGGIFVMQKLDERHVLIAIGQAGANFGALRYTMDKTRTKFEQLLAQTPA